MATPLVEFDPDEATAPSTSLVEAVAAVSNSRIEDLPPLDGVVDTDALDTVFARTTSGRLAVRYGGYVVRVHADGHVAVHAPDVFEGSTPP